MVANITDGGYLDVAFASSNEIDLDEHFGSCSQLVLYRLTPEVNYHKATINFPYVEGHNQQKIAERLNALSDCFAVYCLACGNPVRQQLLTQGIRVVIHSHQKIDQLIEQIQANWPGKIAQRQQRLRHERDDEEYFNQLTQSEWE